MSMTIQEAIKHIATCYKADVSCYHTAIAKGFYGAANVHRRDMDANEMALAALREKAEREDPKPLTLEELRKMDGEPVYVIVPGKPHRNKWCIVELSSPQPGLHGIEYFCDLLIVCTGAVKVYRHKPKEAKE